METAPSVISVSPSSGSGSSQSFTWTVSSPSWYSNLSQVFALFNTSISGANGCYIYHKRGSNSLFLADNSGTVWTGGFVPDSAGSASNSYCTIYGSGSSATPSGNQLAVIVNVAFQSAFAGAKNNYINTYDNEGLYTGWQQMGMWTVPGGQTYSLTTTVSPSAGGNTTPSCPSGCQYASGSQVQIAAAPASGYHFVSWTGNVADRYAATTTVTMSAAQNVMANFSTATPPPAVTLPSLLKGFTYFPRGHAWWRMLYDWYSFDCATTLLPQGNCSQGQRVYEVVESDLARLQQNGINFVHLYIWDQRLAQITGATNGEGFVGAQSGAPSGSPNSQWQALNDFVTRAENHNVRLYIHFAIADYTVNEFAGHQWPTG